MSDSVAKLTARDVVIGVCMVMLTAISGAGGSAAFGVSKAEVVRIETKLDNAIVQFNSQQRSIQALMETAANNKAKVAVMEQRIEQLEKAQNK